MDCLISILKKHKLKLAQLSKKTGIPKDQLEGILHQTYEPSYYQLVQLSFVLKLPISRLLSNKLIEDDFKPIFRASDIAHSEKSINPRAFDFISFIVRMNLQDSRIHTLKTDMPSGSSHYNEAKYAAEIFRAKFFNNDQFSPLNELPKILNDELKLVVKVIELGEKYDGASLVIENQGILLISPRFEGRMLFTLAHELAHIISHHNSEGFMKVDKIKYYNQHAGKGESFANAFASNLLLPEAAIAKSIQSIRQAMNIKPERDIGDIEINCISRFFGVSFDAAAFRLEILGFIPEGGAYSLSKKIKENHKSAEKRAQILGLPDRSPVDFPELPKHVVSKLIDLIKKSEVSIGKAGEQLCVDTKFIYSSNTLN